MSLKLPIYMDHHATTPVDPKVLEAMLPYFTECFGNAASKNHQFGRYASEAVEAARDTISSAIGAKPQEICFTSGATESINLAIKGVFEAYGNKGKHVVSVVTEHKAVLDSIKRIAQHGASFTLLPVDKHGLLNLSELVDAIRHDTILVSVMTANNEIGVLQPIKEIGDICHQREVPFMTDATQALGKIPLNVQEMNIDLLACSAHKLYGPKGIGALYVRRSMPRVNLAAQIDGGGHERGLRSGTLNVPGIVGFSEAVKLATRSMGKQQLQIRALRDRLHNLLARDIEDIKLNGHPEDRLAGNLSICFKGIESEALMISLVSDVALSSGSACTTAAVEPSHVLSALGMREDEIHSSIRFGIGRTNTIEEIDYVAGRITEEVKRLRTLISTTSRK